MGIIITKIIFVQILYVTIFAEILHLYSYFEIIKVADIKSFENRMKLNYIL